MTAEEYRRIIEKFGLTQEQAGTWLGTTPRTGQNYAAKGPTETVAKLLRMMVRKKLKVEDLR